MSTLKTRSMFPRSFPRLYMGVAASIVMIPAQAAISISTSPLLTDSSVAPNIMFVLDDSGSMQWEVMPDDITYFSYLFPIPSANGGSSTYGSTTYSNQIPNFNSNNFYNFFLRSSNNNRVFYDPAITYLPWERYVGTNKVPVTGDSVGNVNVHSAPYNPAAPSRGTLDLDPATAVKLNANWYSNGTGGCSSNMSCAIWPITFYVYNGGGANVNSQSSYTRYQIRNGVAYKATNSGGGAESTVTSFNWIAADGSTVTRTVAEERQNFANWFSYYRSRLLAARGGASLAFSDIGENYRVGFTTINFRGNSSYTFDIPASGGFAGTNREGWFDKLLGVNVGANGTPLRVALQWAGQYYSNSSATTSPWRPMDEAECRRSFTILTTDGYWNGPTPSPSVGNADGTNGVQHVSDLDGVPDSGYVAGPPWEDGRSDTLADVAMHYWKNDLQGVANKVKPTATDPAFWQHMNTFTLSIGVQGSLDPAVVKADPTFSAWPSPFSTNNAKIDDLLHAAMNGRGDFVPARDPAEFSKGLGDALKAIAETAASASSLSGNTTSLSIGSVVFQARYASGNWSGDLLAWALDANGDPIVTIAADGSKHGKWAASEEMPAPANRTIFTSLTGSPNSLVSFATSTGGLAALVGSNKLIDYVRGSEADEGSGTSKFRQRFRNPKSAGQVVSPLGDIVNSTPAFVGAPVDRFYERGSIPGASSYQAFRAAHANRKPLVYVGANDGMLHAFDSDTGKEVFAFIPAALLPKLAELAKQSYAHEFFVDGDITVGDVFDGSGWRTILIASLGRGAKTVFALDVTDPVDANGNAALTSSNLLWEISGDGSNMLGHVLGIPMIAPMGNGQWGVILGNGYNGASDSGHLVIVSALTGSVMKVLATDAVVSHGLSGPDGWDSDRDGDVDLIYAGDLKGRLWKFDVSSASATAWTTANSSTPVFSATDGASPQPITAPPMLAMHPDTGELWIFFGTGKFIEAADRGDTSVQTWYGIRDNVTVDVPSAGSRNRNVLVERLIKEEGTVVRADGSQAAYRLISDVTDSVGNANLVDASGNYVKHGWYIDLKLNGTPGAGERMLVRNILIEDVLFGATLIPNTAPCGELGDGWLMAIYPWIGGRPREDVFDVNGDGKIDANDSVHGDTVTGVKYGNGTLGHIQACKDGLLCFTGSTTSGDSNTEATNVGGALGRLSWREIMGN